MTLCCESSIVNERRDHILAAPLRCKRWTCENCQPIRQRDLKRQARDGNPLIFITITHRPKPGQTADEAARELVHAWQVTCRRAKIEAKRIPSKKPFPAGLPLDPERHTLIKGAYRRMVRLIDGETPFLAIFERTKRGWPHLHILMRARYVDQDWLSVQMGDLIGSPVVWVERVKSAAHAAAYVAKYITKAPEKFEGSKRYWSSHCYACRSKEAETESEQPQGRWRIVWKTLAAIEAAQQAKGWTVIHHRFTTELRPP